MVTTALGTSRVWVTLGYGILNEVYWPATGLPQIRHLGFIVAGSSEWFEVKRVNRYHVSMPDDWVPLPQIAHEGDGYRLLIRRKMCSLSAVTVLGLALGVTGAIGAPKTKVNKRQLVGSSL